MFALAIRIWRYVLTIEIGRAEESESTKDDYEILPLRQFRLGFTHTDDSEDDDDEQ